MPLLLPVKSKTDLARSYHRNMVNVNDYFYVFLGRTQTWGFGDTAPTLTDSRNDIADAQKNIMAVKRVSAADVVLMIDRVDWTSGTIYDRYDDVVDMTTKNFYVYNQANFCIYKCLNRQDYVDGSVPVPSTVLPSDETVEKFSLPDGYWWKLIYYVPATDRQKFLTSEYIPVRFTSSSTSFDHDGLVNTITVTSTGTGYEVAPTVVITGDGKGAVANANINEFGEVTSVDVLRGGISGYSFASVEFYSVGGGAGAAATVELIPSEDAGLNIDIAAAAQATAGSIDFVDVEVGGTNYVYNTSKFNVIGDGTGAYLRVDLNTDSSVKEVSTGGLGAGTGYTFATIESTGPGENAVLRPIIGPPGGHCSNVPAELFSRTLGISVSMSDGLSDFFLNNDFRQIGVVRDIRKYGIKQDVFRDTTGNATHTITVSDPGAYALDEQITTTDGGRYVVVAKTGSAISLLSLVDNITINSSVTGKAFPILSLTEPEVEKTSGDVIFLKNISPITRQTGQTETLRLYLKF